MTTRSRMHCRRFAEPAQALGHAVNLLRSVDPFTSFQFGRLSNVLAGQIRREHYLFTIRDGRPVGYAGWALCDEEVARAWIEERYVPTYEECLDGACVVGITFYARDRAACLFQAKWCRGLYPNRKVFGIRDYGGRRRPFALWNRDLATDADAADRPERGTAAAVG